MPGTFESFARAKLASSQQYSSLFQLRKQMDDERRQKRVEFVNNTRAALQDPLTWQGKDPTDLAQYHARLNAEETDLEMPPTPLVDPRQANFQRIYAESMVKWQHGDLGRDPSGGANAIMAMVSLAYPGDPNGLRKAMWAMQIGERRGAADAAQAAPGATGKTVTTEPDAGPGATPQMREAPQLGSAEVQMPAGMTAQTTSPDALLDPVDYIHQKLSMIQPPKDADTARLMLGKALTDFHSYAIGTNPNPVALQAQVARIVEMSGDAGYPLKPEEVMASAVPTDSEYNANLDQIEQLRAKGQRDPILEATVVRHGLLRQGITNPTSDQIREGVGKIEAEHARKDAFSRIMFLAEDIVYANPVDDGTPPGVRFERILRDKLRAEGIDSFLPTEDALVRATVKGMNDEWKMQRADARAEAASVQRARSVDIQEARLAVAEGNMALAIQALQLSIDKFEAQTRAQHEAHLQDLVDMAQGYHAAMRLPKGDPNRMDPEITKGLLFQIGKQADRERAWLKANGVPNPLPWTPAPKVQTGKPAAGGGKAPEQIKAELLRMTGRG